MIATVDGDWPSGSPGSSDGIGNEPRESISEWRIDEIRRNRGAGVIASQVHLPILLAMDDVRVAWITDANPVVSRSVAASHGVDAVSLEGGVSALTTVDVALIAIPLPPRPIYLDHFAGTETALLVEKPLANNVEEHRRLIAAYAPWRIAVGYQRRFYASFVAVRSFVMSGTLGPLRAIRVSEA